MLLAIDPGSSKCGLAVVSDGGAVAEKRIISSLSVEQEVASLFSAYPIDRVVIGDRTRSRLFARRLVQAGLVPTGGIFFVD